MIGRSIQFFGDPHILMCDGKCNKAWSCLHRPRQQLSEDPEDFAYLADDELVDAPGDPGIYEDGECKPTVDSPRRLNKWCGAHCERSVIVPQDPAFIFSVPDFSKRFYNLKHRQEAANAESKV